MTITIKIKTDNAAFEDKEAEVGRILSHWLATYNLTEPGTITLHDHNGNKVGTVTARGK